MYERQKNNTPTHRVGVYDAVCMVSMADMSMTHMMYSVLFFGGMGTVMCGEHVIQVVNNPQKFRAVGIDAGG